MTLPDIREDFAFDFETRDPMLKTHGPSWAFGKGYVIGVAVAWGDESLYVPFAHERGNTHDPVQVKRWLSHLMRLEVNKFAFNNLYEYGWLLHEECPLPVAPVHDAMIMAALLDEYRKSYSLDSVSKDYLQEQKAYNSLDQYAALHGIKKGTVMEHLWELSGDEVAPYAEQDAALTLKLGKKLLAQIHEEELTEVYDLEMRLLVVLTRMRQRGIKVNLERAQAFGKKWRAEQEQIEMEIIKECGRKVDPWAAATIGPVFEERGIIVPRTPKNKAFSITKEWLDAQEDPLGKKIKRLRNLDRMANVFIDKFFFGFEHNGRIHPEIHPTRSDDGGTVGGRMSYSNPNCQQLPARDEEFGGAIRSCIEPEEGEIFCATDYASQEPRLAIHFAAAMQLTGADRFVQAFKEDPRTDFHKMVADIATIPRKDAKILGLSIMYGAGGAHICEKLGLPTGEKAGRGDKMYRVAGPEGQKILDTFDERVPFVRKMAKKASEVGRSRGYVRTLLKRRCRFPLVDGERWYIHKALNRIIQGSAADQTKKAMVDCAEAGFLPVLSVHDELGHSLKNVEEAKRVAEIMENAIPLLLPVVVDTATGANWGECL